MKILLLHDYGTATGGAELQMLSLRQGLLDRGHQVRLFSSSAKLVNDYPLLADYTCFGTTSKLQVLTQTANFSAYFKLRQAIRSFQPDVVHIRMFLWQLSPLILPLLRDIPCIYQTAIYKAICPAGTNILPDGSPCRSTPGRVCLASGCLTPKTWAVLMLQWRLWEQWRTAIDRIVALSHGMKRELELAGLTPVDTIHNGVASRSQRLPLQEPPTVAYAGRLVSEKGVDILLKAFATVRVHCPNARLLIAGQGQEAAALRRLASQLGIADSVQWLGHISRSELENSFDQAWVQVIPSLWAEPFGNVTTEAMMRGTAVVASAIGAQPEIIVDGETGFLVSPGDVSALSKSLVQLLSDKDLAEKMGALGRHRALQEFSDSSRTSAFVKLYKEVQREYSVSHPSKVKI